MGIEPTSEAWEAPVLPLYDARSLFEIVLLVDLPESGLLIVHGFTVGGTPRHGSLAQA